MVTATAFVLTIIILLVPLQYPVSENGLAAAYHHANSCFIGSLARLLGFRSSCPWRDGKGTAPSVDGKSFLVDGHRHPRLFARDGFHRQGGSGDVAAVWHARQAAAHGFHRAGKTWQNPSSGQRHRNPPRCRRRHGAVSPRAQPPTATVSCLSRHRSLALRRWQFAMRVLATVIVQPVAIAYTRVHGMPMGRVAPAACRLAG